MPNRPHSSWNRSSSRHVALKAAPPRVFDAIHGHVHHHTSGRAHGQPLAAGRSDPAPGNRRLRHQCLELALLRRLDAHHHPRGPFAEQRLVEPTSALHRDSSAIPSIACANCHRISGRSAEPKFMQSVTPRGRPPAHETLRAASHTASAPPRRGSRTTWRPLPTVETAIVRRVPLILNTAASEPGSTSVLVPTCWSYCRYAHSLE